MSRLGSTSVIHRDVIHANGQHGSTNRSTSVEFPLELSSMEAIVAGWSDRATELDAVEGIAQRWQEIDPDLDASPMLIIGRIHRIAALLDDRLRPPFAAAGLSNGDFDLLAALRRQPSPHELRPGSLATVMMVTTGATSKRIDRLEAQGLVTRRVSGDDARSRLVALTDRGRSMVDDLIGVHLDNEAAALAALTPENAHRLARILAGLLRSLEPRPGSGRDGSIGHRDPPRPR